MKTTFQHTLLAVLLITLFASVSFAQETKSTSQAHPYLKNGLHAGLSASVIGFVEKGNDWRGDNYHLEIALPKLSLTIGYRLNPYISLDVNAWSVILLSSVEFAPKINFTNSRISPFASASIGYGTALQISPDSSEEENSPQFIAYSAKVGVDGHMTKHTNLYLSVGGYYNPEYGTDRSISERILITPELGFQWKF